MTDTTPANNLVRVPVKVTKQVTMSHGFEPPHFSAAVVVKGGDWNDTITDICPHRHPTRAEANTCRDNEDERNPHLGVTPTPHAVGLTDGRVLVLVPEGGRW